jgi:CRISPR/Cas system-associated endonuclease Cas1
MTVHLVNRTEHLASVEKLVAQDDVVIFTGLEIDAQLLHTLLNESVTVHFLEGTLVHNGRTGTHETPGAISEAEWVRYTTANEAVISWG